MFLFVLYGMKKKTDFIKILYSALSTLLLCVMCVFVLFTFFFHTVKVNGDSMNPGLHENDKIIISNFLYKPSYGDIIAVNRGSGEEKTLIKRVIALGGDEINIDFDTHLITVNDRVITENYRVAAPISKKGDTDFPVTVPENCVFVLGDNRNDSLDSRYSEVGFIKLDEIWGKAVCRISPFGQFNIK